jgi:hypothetical protein
MVTPNWPAYLRSPCNTACCFSMLTGAAIGEKPLLIGNVGNHVMTRTAQYMNGMYMEGFGSNFFPDWHTAAANMAWAETHLHKPSLTALEEWWQTGRVASGSSSAAGRWLLSTRTEELRKSPQALRLALPFLCEDNHNRPASVAMQIHGPFQ